MLKSHQSYIVAESSDGERLDKYLAGVIATMSRTRVKAIIECGQIEIDKIKITEPAYRVKHSQEIIVTIIAEPIDAKPLAQSIKLNIVFEDNNLIVIDKPAGMVVHPAPGNPDKTLVNALIAHCGKSLSGIGGERRPGIVHRLDKDTSGLLVAAKNDITHIGLSKLFEKRELQRTYCAIVWGKPKALLGTVKGNIGRNSQNRKKMDVVTRGGRSAETGYKIVNTYAKGAFSELQCKLKTGRTHQIRVHMAHIGHPIVGDTLYGGAKLRNTKCLSVNLQKAIKGISRQALHAQLLAFTHPITGVELEFKSKLPIDIKTLLLIAKSTNDS